MNYSLRRVRPQWPVAALLLVLLSLTALLGAARPAQAETTELFFSEYIEGSSNNKAFEIYNGTGSAIDLAAGGYNVQMFFNGSATAGLTINLTGTVADGDVYVVAHASATQAILDQADLTNNAGWFNGDDAVVLRKGTDVIDSLGQVGVDPGVEWGTGLTSTADNTLRRKTGVCAGDPDAGNPFDPALEWDGFATDTFDGLGAHSANCGVTSPDIVINEFSASTAGDDVEYVEFYGAPNTDYSAYTFLEIEGDSGASAGTIDEVISLGTTDANGLYLVNLPVNAIENGSITLLLVSNFTGAFGVDLDADDDGVFDSTPWDAIVDAIAINDGGASDLAYGVPVLGVSYDGLPFAPGGASRIPDGFDTDAATDWVRNDFDLAGIPGFEGTPIAGEAFNTPGAPNAIVTPDQPVVVVSQIYGGGGNSGATYTHDFIELYNAGASAVDLTDWSMQYASAAGSSWQVTTLSGSIAPGGYYLIQQAVGSGGTTPLPPPDATGATAMSATAGKVALVSNATTLTGSCPTGDAIVDFVGYGATANCFEGTGPTPAPSNTTAVLRLDNGNQDTDDNAADFETGAPNPRNSGTGSTPTETLISAIQGSGPVVTPGTFTVEAIVVGDYQTQGLGQLRGFFIQEEDADADADPATSEGIFVFCADCPVEVSVGDLVRVTGASSEFFDMSQLTASTIDSVTVLSSGNPLPTPASVELPVPGVPSGDLAAAIAAINAYFEAFEGMLVTFPDTLSVAEYFELARYGQVILTEGGRPHTFTAVNEPSAGGLIDHEIDLASRTIILDDTDNRQNRPVDSPNTPYFHPVPGLSTTNFFRGGDTITGLTGVLHWSFAGQTGTDAWRIRPVTEAFDYTFTPANPRPALPDVPGSVRVASFNVLNYFLTVDTTASNDNGFCGPSGTMDCRGADSQAELDRQREKLQTALAAIGADVYGFMEMENTPGVEPLADIVAGLPGYAYVDTGAVGTDAIRVGIIYNSATVAPVGSYAILDSSVDPRFNDGRNRPAVAQTFEEIATGARFTVVVNHLKSKGSGCGPGDDDPITGQGNCNGTRTLAAQALADWLATDPTGSGDPDVLIIGDLNSYAKEDPIAALQDAGYTDLVAHFGGPGAYGYVFDGQLGYLDHALSNASLTPQVAGVSIWHINADEIPLFDYNDDVADAGEAAFEEESDVLPLYEPDQFRTSDHDPVIIGLNLEAPAPPTVDAGGPYSVVEGGAVDVTATGSDPAGGELAYAWDLDNDGAFETPGQTATFDATGLTAPAVYTIRVQATSITTGLTAEDDALVTILYPFDGFFPPIDNPPTFNVVNAGRAIPVKFSLGGDRGLDIFAEGYPQITFIACETGAPQDGVEETLTAGNSQLTYNPVTDTYTFAWKTNKSWQNTCVELAIQLNDGSTYIALFRFRP